jgi:hypothetical protein
LINNSELLKSKLLEHLERLYHLSSQIPTEFRELLTLRHMRYRHFKSDLFEDNDGKLGFEVYRERGSKTSINKKVISHLVEKQICGVYGTNNLFNVEGKAQFTNLVFANHDFQLRYGSELQANASTLVNSQINNTGVMKVGKNGNCKIVNCRVAWLKGKEKVVKNIIFAWIFGNLEPALSLDPAKEAEYEFYSCLFSKLSEIITQGFSIFDANLRVKIRAYYVDLLNRIDSEFRQQLTLTSGDEYVFQQILDKYQYFLYPSARTIESQFFLKSTESKRPDYRIVLNENQYIYVEIEPPYYDLFELNKPSRRLQMALEQIQDWRNIISQNEEYGRNPSFLIIIGLNAKLHPGELELLNRFNSAESDLTVVTWDYILENLKSIRDWILNPNK